MNPSDWIDLGTSLVLCGMFVYVARKLTHSPSKREQEMAETLKWIAETATSKESIQTAAWRAYNRDAVKR